MLFSSITFLYCFLPVTFFLYYVTPKKGKNLILFLASFFFYLWGEPKYSLLLILSVVIGYFGGRIIPGTDAKAKKMVTGFFIAVSLAMLGYFKYADFFLTSINHAAGGEITLLHLSLPVGISFYSFQIISYYVDVYRGDVKAEKNIIDFAAYVTMFPQLIAGPIVRFRNVQIELKERTVSLAKMSDGAQRFVCGLCKKVLIADTLGELVTYLENVTEKMACSGIKPAEGVRPEGLGTAGYWILALAFMLQLYYDFSGYSDMAIGLGKMLGFTFPENFNYPYLSKSISEFWRRWHMTLGSWFRDYLYLPLGGNRVSIPRWCLNMLLVWFFSGLWHGAGWNFALWGVYFGVFLCAEKLLAKRSKVFGNKKKKNVFGAIAGHFYVILTVFFSFVIFREERLPEIGRQFLGLFGKSNTVMSAQTAYEIKSYAFLMFIAIIGATPLMALCREKIAESGFGQKCNGILQGTLTLFGLILATSYLIGNTVHPFLYFRF